MFSLDNLFLVPLGFLAVVSAAALIVTILIRGMEPNQQLVNIAQSWSWRITAVLISMFAAINLLGICIPWLLLAVAGIAYYFRWRDEVNDQLEVVDNFLRRLEIPGDIVRVSLVSAVIFVIAVQLTNSWFWGFLLAAVVTFVVIRWLA